MRIRSEPIADLQHKIAFSIRQERVGRERFSERSRKTGGKIDRVGIACPPEQHLLRAEDIPRPMQP